MPEVKECCWVMAEMMENEIFRIEDELLLMNTFIQFKNSYINMDYQVDYCPNCGKKVEVICE